MSINKVRFEALDAFRGLAILMMILSGAIPFGGALPGWMYHAQEPPPQHVFNPSIPGITWVDLIFPFFLFSMGAAIPFSLGSRLEKGIFSLKLTGHLLWRFAGLALFAIISLHFRPWSLDVSENSKHLLALASMAGMLMVFASPAKGWWNEHRKWVTATGWLVIGILFLILHENNIRSFSLEYFDIIIMILANTALGGGVLYVFYRKWNNTLWGVFALLAAFFLCARDGNNWVESLFDWSPVSWLISWDYLKYLVVIIPGIYTGKIVRQQLNQGSPEHSSFQGDKVRSAGILVCSVFIILVAVIGLYRREVELAFSLSAVVLIVLYFLVMSWKLFWSIIFVKVLPVAIVLILGGYFLEPLHGGIKKDPATLSYLFLTAGLSVTGLLTMVVLIHALNLRKFFSLLTGSGKNAMLAYVAGSNLVVPVLTLTGIDQLFETGGGSVTLKVVKALVITLCVGWVSACAARKRMFMRV
jgi:predicted acyltransferase